MSRDKSTPKSTESEPESGELTPELRAILEEVVRRKKKDFDLVGLRDKTTLKACETLSKLGYLDWTETGAGGRIQRFRPTGKGFAAAEPKPDPLPEPESAVLTPKLRAQLVDVVHRKQVRFELRYNVDRDALDACKTLSQMGYLDWTETGPGGSAQVFRPTEKAIALVETSPPPAPGE